MTVWWSQGPQEAGPSVNTTRQYFALSAAQTKNPGTGAPTDVEYPFTLAKRFTVDNDFVVVKYHKPNRWMPGSNIIFRLNWTKYQDTDQSGNKVKWQIEYLFTDIGYDISNATPDGTLTSEQTYTDSGTTTHIAYDTNEDLEITTENVQEDKDYLYVKIGPIAPSANALVEPVLLTIVMSYYGYNPIIL